MKSGTVVLEMTLYLDGKRVFETRSDIKMVGFEDQIYIEVIPDFPSVVNCHGGTVTLCDLSLKSKTDADASVRIISVSPDSEDEVWYKTVHLIASKKAKYRAKVETNVLYPGCKYYVSVDVGGRIFATKPVFVKINDSAGDLSTLAVSPLINSYVSPNEGETVELGKLLLEPVYDGEKRYTTVLRLDGEEIFRDAILLKGKPVSIKLDVSRRKILFRETCDHLLEYSVVNESGTSVSSGTSSVNILSCYAFDKADFIGSFKRFMSMDCVREFIRSLNLVLNGYHNSGKGFLEELSAVSEAIMKLDITYKCTTSEFKGLDHGRFQSAQPPARTIKLKCGNCLDMSIFMCTVYTILGLHACLFYYGKHVLPGIVIPETIKLSRSLIVDVNGVKVLPIESTIPDFQSAVRSASKTIKTDGMGEVFFLNDVSQMPFFFPTE